MKVWRKRDPVWGAGRVGCSRGTSGTGGLGNLLRVGDPVTNRCDGMGQRLVVFEMLEVGRACRTVHLCGCCNRWGGGGTCLGARLHSLICYDVIHAVSPSSLRGIYPMGELGAGLHLQDRLSGHYTSCPMTASNLIETLCGQWIHSSTIISQVSPSPPSYSFISRYSETATLKPLDGERYHFKAFNS